MKRISLLIILILFSIIKVNANRAMYVNDFFEILGDESKEHTLLSYAQDNEIETLLLYELHLVNNQYDITNVATNGILADFISKAKTCYGILYVGATSENGDSFTNIIDVYNNSRSNANEKFDIYNLEFEFWVDHSVEPGGVYCESYLTENGLECNNDGAFEFFMTTLQTMNDLADNNSHPIKVEAYIGWPTTAQMTTISTNVDRLRVHAYINDPNASFSYTDDRLIDLANGNPELDVSIIYSSEPDFMQDWLLDNSMSEAEEIFMEQWTDESVNWENNVNIEGFTYFAYTFNEGITLGDNSLNTNELFLNNAFIYPNPVKDILKIDKLEDLVNIKVYNNICLLYTSDAADD